MLSTEPIDQLIDALPQTSLTTRVLGALDFVVPGQWQNLTGWQATVAAASSEQDPARRQMIAERALAIYNDPSRGYQRAAWIYLAVDNADKAVAAAVLASKAGEKINFLSFLDKFTPKSDTTQAVDLALKVAAEAMAFAALEGLPDGGAAAFGEALAEYGRENAMRMAALICLDGLLPLGPDFLDKGMAALGGGASALADSKLFAALGEALPGVSEGDRLAFIGEAFQSARARLSEFTTARGLSQEKVLGALRDALEVSDDKLDYVGAFFDATTNYFAHTGLQTVAHMLIEEAADEVDEDIAAEVVATSAAPEQGGTSRVVMAAGAAAAVAGLGCAAYKHFSGDEAADAAVYQPEPAAYNTPEGTSPALSDLQQSHAGELESLRQRHFDERRAAQARGPRWMEMMERHRAEVEGLRSRHIGERQARRGGGPGPGFGGPGGFRPRGRGPGGGRGPARSFPGRGMGPGGRGPGGRGPGGRGPR